MSTSTTQGTTREAVVAALTSGGQLSAADVAMAAGIGRSTATKTLAALAADGQVRRSPGGRDGARRLPDLWSTVTPASTPKKPRAARTTETTAAASGVRLGRGELTGQVLDYLQTHPGEHSPASVAAQLGGRSTGAVSNALDRLVERKQATLTQQRPRRYAAITR
jgi:predicted ArsR family transcriptional regulator